MEEESDLIKLVAYALKLNEQLWEKYSDYPPVYNSKFMLSEIYELHKNKVSFKQIENRQKLNVGLLAAMSLDFDPDPQLAHYGHQLHLVWSIISPIRLHIKNPKKKLAYDFFRAHGIPATDISGRLAGINFSKNVIPLCLRVKKQVFQWDILNQQGNYYAKFKNTSPSKLGVNSRKEDYAGRVFHRTERCYMVCKDIIVLYSIAAAVVDTWSVKGRPVKTKGGGAQYFNQNDKMHIIKI